MELLVYSPVYASWIFTYGSASEPQSPPNESLEDSVTHRVNPKPHNYPTNPVLNVPSNPDLHPSLSYYPSSESSFSPDCEYYKRIQRAKKYKKKHRIKTCFDEPIKKCVKFTAKLPTTVYKSNIIRFILDEDTLQRRFYFLSFMNPPKILLSQF